MQQVTTRTAAQILGVSEASIKRWCDDGRLEAAKTPGGHRRIAERALISFARKNRYPLQHPELIDMPADVDVTSREPNDALPRILQALVTGDNSQVRRVLLDYYLGGTPLEKIFDSIILPAFDEIGKRGGNASAERTACDLLDRVVQEMSAYIMPEKKSDSLAIGGSLAGDRHTVPSAMVDMVLRDRGWRTLPLGSQLKPTSIEFALELHQPNLLWITVSKVADENSFLEQQQQLSEACRQNNAFLVMGGRGLTADLRRKMAYSVCCDTFTHLTSLLESIFERRA